MGSVALLKRRQQIGLRQERDGESGRGRQVLNRSRGQTAAPEERVDLAVFERPGRFAGSKGMPRDAESRIDARRGQETIGDEFGAAARRRSEEHTSELQSQSNLVCRLLLEKKKKYKHDD